MSLTVVELSKRLTERGQEAAEQSDWRGASDLATAALAADPANADAKALRNAANSMLDAVRPKAKDEQTGMEYVLRREGTGATIAATLSGLYSLTALVVFVWFVFDTWIGRNRVAEWLGYSGDALDSGAYRLIAFTAAGGAIGGVLNAIRSLISWHAERHAFGTRFIWKDVCAPFIGGTVGVIAYATVRTGVGVVTGDISLDDSSATPILTGFALAAVAGFSWHQVFKWLDAQANRIFRAIPA